MNLFKKTALVLAALFAIQVMGQDKGKMVEYTNTFLKKIEDSHAEFTKKPDVLKKKFWLDVEGKDLPTSASQFKQIWHFPSVSQGYTGTCWSFSTTSFLESEVYRLHGEKINLSELYIAYWEYVEKARGFVRSKGESIFEEGSQSQAVLRILDWHGVVPLEAYDGLLEGQTFHHHKAMHREMKHFLNAVKRDNAWNEAWVLATIRSILDQYITPPPTEFKYKGKTYTPKSFYREVVKLNTDDYVDLLSLIEKPLYEYTRYDVPDNWWKGSKYYNITLDDFMATLRKSMKEGYSICLGGDVSESGYLPLSDVAMVPSYDIPSANIDEYARQFRFSNHSTTDDHGIHCVGAAELNGQNWYLIKDSGSGSRNGNEKGYYFYHEDYIKLKMMNIMVHKDMARDLLKKQK
ncbi:MAG: peptidase C1 [Acidobacteria bacterium]|nr:MAG: peptidase C1 [Acidobacteriota bacterium]